jgi:hypothetical protein
LLLAGGNLIGQPARGRNKNENEKNEKREENKSKKNAHKTYSSFVALAAAACITLSIVLYMNLQYSMPICMAGHDLSDLSC